MNFALPELVCRRRSFGELNADASAEAWQAAASAELVDVTSGSRPRQGTTVRVAWDEQELRVLFDCIDSHPWATLQERDAPLYQEEVVEVFIDPVGDLLSYFEFEVNPLNAVLDLVIRRNRSGWVKDFRWSCAGLRSAVRTTPEGWAAELALPFAEIAPEPPKPGTEWRVNFCRIDRPPQVERELSAWSPTGLAQFHVPERFGILRFAQE